MRILFITRKYPPSIGGMQTFSAALAAELKDEMDVIALGRSSMHVLWWLPYAFAQILWCGRRYDVIHLGDGVIALLGVLAKWWTHKPVTITVHGLDLTYQRFGYQHYIWWALQYFDRIICVSTATADIARQKINSAKISIIPNGIRVADWPEPTAIVARLPKQLLTVGRLVPRKGVAWFIAEVMPLLPNDMTYHIVGIGPQADVIRAVIAQHQLEQRVIMHGRVSDQVLKELYQTSAAFIMPNIQQPNDMEGFGIVALEAAMTGLPVIAADLEGLHDAVIDGVTGFLVESRSVSAWRATIQKLTEQPIFTPATMRAAVIQRFSWQVIAEAYRQTFNHLRP